MRITLFLLSIVLSSSFIVHEKGLDSQKSGVSFSINNMIFNTVEGSFKNFKGEVEFDINKPESSSFKIQIPVASIDTENEDRDKHLLAKKYFDAEKYPFIEFNSTFVNKTAEGFDITGNLKIKGLIKAFTIPFTSEKTKDGFLLKGQFEIDRYDFKVGPSGSFGMGREVSLKINCFLKN